MGHYYRKAITEHRHIQLTTETSAKTRFKIYVLEKFVEEKYGSQKKNAHFAKNKNTLSIFMGFTCWRLQNMDGWMTRFFDHFSCISVISRQREGDIEVLCVMETRERLKRLSASAGKYTRERLISTPALNTLNYWDIHMLTILHWERPKLYGVLAVLSAIWLFYRSGPAVIIFFHSQLSWARHFKCSSV